MILALMRKLIADLKENSGSASSSTETAIVFVTNLGLIVISLGSQSMLAWMLGPEGRGAYAVCVLFATIMGVVFSFGVDRASQYFLIARRHSVSSSLTIAFTLTLTGSFVALILSWFLIDTGLSFFDKAEQSSFQASLILIPLTISFTVLHLQLAALRMFVELGAACVIQGLTNLLLIPLLAIVFDLGVNGAIIAYIGGFIAGIVAALSMLRTKHGYKFERVRLRELKDVLSYGLRYYAARLGHLLDAHVATIILAMMATQAEVGLFVAVSLLVLKLQIFSDSIEASLLPRITSNSSKVTEIVEQCVRLTALFTALAAVLVMVLAIPLTEYILSPAFLAAAPLVLILGPSIIFHGTSKIILAYFRATNRPEICSTVVIVGLAINCLGLLTLYPSMGLVGAAWAMAIAFVVRSLLILYAYRYITGRRVLELMRPQANDLHAISLSFSRISKYILFMFQRKIG